MKWQGPLPEECQGVKEGETLVNMGLLMNRRLLLCLALQWSFCHKIPFLCLEIYWVYDANLYICRSINAHWVIWKIF